jgi:hypothetical protein
MPYKSTQNSVYLGTKVGVSSVNTLNQNNRYWPALNSVLMHGVPPRDVKPGVRVWGVISVIKITGSLLF